MMLADILTTEMIWDSMLQATKLILPIFTPYILPVIALLFIIYLLKSCIYHFALIGGDSKRQAKKKVKIAENLMNLISAFNNVFRGIK